MDIDPESVTDRIRLGLNYLDQNPDPAMGWMPYSGGVVTGPASHYAHSEWDSCDAGWRMVEAYLLARRATGQADPGPREEGLRAFVRSTLREDGLSYRIETPWCRPEAFVFDQGRALIALATWMRLEPSEGVASLARRMADGMERIAIGEGDGTVYPAENWTGSGWGTKVYAHPPTGMTIEGLVDLSRLLGDGRLLEMAGREVLSVRKRPPALFTEDGTLVPKGGGPYAFWFTHLHSRLAILLGIVKYAVTVSDNDLLRWCVRSFRFVKDRMSGSFGWVPESLEKGTDPGTKWLSSRRRDEGCCISDMMQIAAVLAGAGFPEETALIGRYGTNQIFAHQHVEYQRCRHLMGSEGGVDTEQVSFRGMPERGIGGSCCGTYPNDVSIDLRSFGLQENSIDIAGCCSPAGIKALYLLQETAVRRRGDRLEIALWVTMDGQEVEMRCAEPLAGELRVVIKRPCRELALRVPDSVSPAEIQVDRESAIQDGAVVLGSMREGEAVTIRYPLAERVGEETIAGEGYRVRWKGGRVVEVSPPGSCDPYWWRRAAR